MSDIGLILNGLLGLLLLGALALGWRLEGRLKALRASQTAFIRAVEDLDRAAARAEQGLADLRAATDEAAESLAGGIDRANTLSAKLETLTREATNVEARLGSAPQKAMTREAQLARLTERYAAPKASEPARPTPGPRADLILEDEPQPAPEPPAVAARLQRLKNLAQLQAQMRASAAREDELFAAPRRAGGGGR